MCSLFKRGGVLCVCSGVGCLVVPVDAVWLSWERPEIVHCVDNERF